MEILTWQNSGGGKQRGHPPTQGVMECSAFGLSFYVQCKQVCAAAGRKPRIESRPVALTANVSLKCCWPSDNMARDIWSASGTGLLSSLRPERQRQKWEIRRRKSLHQSPKAVTFTSQVCAPHSILTSIFCAAGWPDRGVRRARGHSFKSICLQYCPGQSNSTLRHNAVIWISAKWHSVEVEISSVRLRG